MKRFTALIVIAFLSVGCQSLNARSDSPQSTLQDELSPQQIHAEADYLAHLAVEVHRPWNANEKNNEVFTQETAILAGFVVAYEGQPYIITASHIKPPGGEVLSIKAYFKNHEQNPEPFELVGYDRRCDTAVLRPVNPNFVFTGRLAKLGEYKSIGVDSKIVSLGSPYGLRYQMTTGKVLVLDRVVAVGGMPYELKVFEHNAKTMPGYSGGPTLNRQGEVVGMEVAGYNGPQGNRGEAIPIDDIKKILPELIGGLQYD